MARAPAALLGSLLFIASGADRDEQPRCLLQQFKSMQKHSLLEQEPPVREEAMLSQEQPASATSLLSHLSSEAQRGSRFLMDKFEPIRKQSLESNFKASAMSALTFGILTAVTALLYSTYKENPTPVESNASDGLKDGEWKYGIFDCFSDPAICLFTCCCSPIRWADTLQMAGLMSFWQALGLLAGLEVLNILLLGLCVWILILITQVVFRQKLRAKFGMDAGDCPTVAGDACLYCFCFCCAVVQEARQLEEAYKTGHRVMREAQEALAARP